MTNFFKKIFGLNEQNVPKDMKFTVSVTRYIDGKKIEFPKSRKILREPNLIENISIPTFAKKFDKDIKVPDSKNLRRKFLVNLFTMDCNCPDFQEKHKIYPPYHLKRICQHLKDAMDEPLRQINPFLRKLVVRFYSKPNDLFYLVNFNENYIIHFEESSYWVNIIAEHQPDIRYAYNIVERRWSSAGLPDKEHILVSEISKIICLEY